MTVDAEAVARRYISCSNAVDYEGMADLFADDAEWYPLTADPVVGIATIRDRYVNEVRARHRPIVDDRYYGRGATCVVEFEVDLGAGNRAHLVDIFTVNVTGKITRLAVYQRGS